MLTQLQTIGIRVYQALIDITKTERSQLMDIFPLIRQVGPTTVPCGTHYTVPATLQKKLGLALTRVTNFTESFSKVALNTLKLRAAVSCQLFHRLACQTLQQKYHLNSCQQFLMLFVLFYGISTSKAVLNTHYLFFYGFCEIMRSF